MEAQDDYFVNLFTPLYKTLPRKLSDFLSNHYVILDEKIDFLGEKFINDVILETRKFYFNIPDFLINNSEEKFLQSLEEF
jgi:hypothetical protein